MILNSENQEPNKYIINDFFREKSYKIFQRKYYTKFIYLNISKLLKNIKEQT